MSETQFIALLTPSVGSVVLVILAWLYANSRLSDLRSDTGRHFDGLHKRLDRIDSRLDRLDDRLDRVDQDLREFYGSNRKLEGRVDELSRQK